MPASYQKLAFAGRVTSVVRLADSTSFAVPQDGEGDARYRENPDYLRYLADVAGGATVADPEPAPVVYGRTTTVDQRLRTTTATPAEIARWTLAGLTGYRAKLELLAVDAGNGAVKTMEATIVAKRLAGGALIVGTPAVVVNIFDVAASAWTVAASASGNDVVIAVTGAAGRTIDWALSGRVVSFTPAGES